MLGRLTQNSGRTLQFAGDENTNFDLPALVPLPTHIERQCLLTSELESQSLTKVSRTKIEFSHLNV